MALAKAVERMAADIPVVKYTAVPLVVEVPNTADLHTPAAAAVEHSQLDKLALVSVLGRVEAVDFEFWNDNLSTQATV